MRIAENFNKVINDEEKNNLVESNSDKIYEDCGKIINFPLYSIYGSYNNIQDFGNYYLEKYSKELNEEGLNGLAKYLIDLINCYNNSIKSLK